MSFDRDSFQRDGAALAANAVSPDWLARLEPLFEVSARAPGRRILALDHDLGEAVGHNGPLGSLAREVLQGAARPVRVLVFDKSADANWSVAWHQDRQIAVAARRDADGFRNWTRKDGIDHVEPPFEYLARLITLRLHFDDCGADNGPLMTIPGSHLAGRVKESGIKDLMNERAAQAHVTNRGDVLLLQSCIVHASARTLQPRRRRVLHVEFSPDVRPGHLEWALQHPGAA